MATHHASYTAWYPIPEEANPVDLLLGHMKFFVPESRMTPSRIAELYRRTAEMLDLRGVSAKHPGSNEPCLETLRSIISYPGSRFNEREPKVVFRAATEVVQRNLPNRVTLQTLFWPFFGFCFPRWSDLPKTKEPIFEDAPDGPEHDVISVVESDALLMSKFGGVYIAKARWKPAERESDPNTDGSWDMTPVYYDLESVDLTEVDWDGALILEKVANEWGNYRAFLLRINMMLSWASQETESRSLSLAAEGDLFENAARAIGRTASS